VNLRVTVRIAESPGKASPVRVAGHRSLERREYLGHRFERHDGAAIAASAEVLRVLSMVCADVEHAIDAEPLE
jgi:hypothetical protein